jgi:hypothetical protein
MVSSISQATGWSTVNAYARQRFLTAAPSPEGFRQLNKFHSDVAELTPEAVDCVMKPDQIAKLHIVPTDNNLTLLHNSPKVVLLRPADEIVAAYWRGMETRTWATTVGEIARCKSLEEWQQVAAEMGLTKELQRFNDQWLADTGDRLVIHYRDLVKKPAVTLSSVFNYAGIDAEQVPDLAKVNYSRNGGVSTSSLKRTYFAAKTAWARFRG